MKNLRKYLGDGVLAEFDGENFVLTTEDGTTNRIHLSLDGLDALLDFVKDSALALSQDVDD